MKLLWIPAVMVVASAALGVGAEKESAENLARDLSAKQRGTSLVRVRLANAGEVFQLTIKNRNTEGKAQALYEVLFPKERKGERLLVERSGSKLKARTRSANGETTEVPITSPLFASALSCEDAIDDPFAWSDQKITGTEMVNNVEAQILESRPGDGRGSYSLVRTWVDAKRLVPLRIEKYGPGGKLVRRIDVTRVLKDGDDSLPVNLSVRGPDGRASEIDGSKIQRGANLQDSDFDLSAKSSD